MGGILRRQPADERVATKDSLMRALTAFGFTKLTVNFEHPDHPHGPALAILRRKGVAARPGRFPKHDTDSSPVPQEQLFLEPEEPPEHGDELLQFRFSPDVEVDAVVEIQQVADLLIHVGLAGRVIHQP